MRSLQAGFFTYIYLSRTLAKFDPCIYSFHEGLSIRLFAVGLLGVETWLGTVCIDCLSRFHCCWGRTELAEQGHFTVFISDVVPLEHCSSFELAKWVPGWELATLLDTNLEDLADMDFATLFLGLRGNQFCTPCFRQCGCPQLHLPTEQVWSETKDS